MNVTNSYCGSRMEWIWVEKSHKNGYERMIISSEPVTKDSMTKRILIGSVVAIMKYLFL